jgi:hypothetical protein
MAMVAETCANAADASESQMASSLIPDESNPAVNVKFRGWPESPAQSV